MGGLRFQRQSGASPLEMVCLICLILVFIWIVTVKVWELRMVAERTGVSSTIGVLQSALGMEVAGRAVKQGMPAVVALEGSNPMDLLEIPPPNYRGELKNADPSAIPGRQWYFDVDEGVLVYRVEFKENFSSSLPGPARIRLAIRVSFQDTDQNGKFDPEHDRLRNVSLRQLDHYQWISSE
jgi:hypothetical protein